MSYTVSPGEIWHKYEVIRICITPLRMYRIDRPGVPESHDACPFHCLYDKCMLVKIG